MDVYCVYIKNYLYPSITVHIQNIIMYVYVY